MSDLISRSELLKALSEAEDNYRAEHHDCVMNDDPFSDGILSAMFSVFQIVKSQPTAYSVDKVIEELEKIEQHCLDMSDWQGQSAICDAIEIVKQGGVSDDVCEWKIDGVYLHSPHIRPLVTCIADDEDYRYNFCPVCGKKIKAVE